MLTPSVCESGGGSRRSGLLSNRTPTTKTRFESLSWGIGDRASSGTASPAADAASSWPHPTFYSNNIKRKTTISTSAAGRASPEQCSVKFALLAHDSDLALDLILLH
ncbi:hypothetical protein EVAR_65798_1 [Eumeta japonica]|uniref:Uncharacterized protein n=1 Tax=Eumeta variegata TaxID=151549 RepID=A0A4C1ZR30_EUMVA|nr:hypothetical protein EVAR_65798_1 [Eumeta japonica]